MNASVSLGARLTQPFRSVVTYIRTAYEELKKVTWPTRDQATQYTLIVIVSVLVVTGLTAALDYGLPKLLEQLISWSQR